MKQSKRVTSKRKQKNSSLNLEVFGSNKAQISRNPVTNPHFHNVTNNKFFRVNAALLSLPHHGSKLQPEFRHLTTTPMKLSLQNYQFLQ